MGIDASEDLLIPMTMKGSTCGVFTHPPTDDDINEFQNILPSDEFDWDPSNNLFEISSMEEEYSKSSSFHLYINIFYSRVPCAPPKIQCRDDSGIHDFYRAMENVSIGMDQDLMVDIFISKVRVKRTRSVFATHTDKRHHGISTDILSRKWWIGLDKSKRNLQSTTQYNVRSALKPLTWSYRIYLLSQRLHRMNWRFYTDTLFEK